MSQLASQVEATTGRFSVGGKAGEVSSLLLAPSNPCWIVVLAHGAGAGMRHPFMEEVARRLSQRGVGVFRYQFPYMEAGGRRPDPPPVLIATVRAAVEAAAEALPRIPLLAGGKSMGGRMTSQAAANAGLPSVVGIPFFGFPLHPAGRPSTDRGTHLQEVSQPMLFLQGTRDSLADLELLAPLCGDLGPRARLHVIEGADHSFHVLKRSGRSDQEVLDELADATVHWAAGLGSGSPITGGASPQLGARAGEESAR